MMVTMMTLEFGGKKKLLSTGIVERTEWKLAVSRAIELQEGWSLPKTGEGRVGINFR